LHTAYLLSIGACHVVQVVNEQHRTAQNTQQPRGLIYPSCGHWPSKDSTRQRLYDKCLQVRVIATAFVALTLLDVLEGLGSRFSHFKVPIFNVCCQKASPSTCCVNKTAAQNCLSKKSTATHLTFGPVSSFRTAFRRSSNSPGMNAPTRTHNTAHTMVYGATLQPAVGQGPLRALL
jgi:hypothetical protein